MKYVRLRTANTLARPFLACLLVGSSWVATTASAATLTFSNAEPIAIPEFGPADPYPSVITVSGITAPIVKVTATLIGFSHTFPDDVGALLVGPGGQSTFLFNGASSGEAAVDLTWTFDDAAAAALPNTGPLVSGSFRPSSYYQSDVFPPPAPGGPYPQSLSVFNGLSAGSVNGAWLLYIHDFVPVDGGSVSGGWSLAITTGSGPGPRPGKVPEPATIALFGLGLAGFAARQRRPATSA